MKKIFIHSIILLFLSAGFYGCHSTVGITSNQNGVPPGQMKKMTGSKSAKPYAPGQNKPKKNKSKKGY